MYSKMCLNTSVSTLLFLHFGLSTSHKFMLQFEATSLGSVLTCDTQNGTQRISNIFQQLSFKVKICFEFYSFYGSTLEFLCSLHLAFPSR